MMRPFTPTSAGTVRILIDHPTVPCMYRLKVTRQ
jgi:hypothetical protein